MDQQIVLLMLLSCTLATYAARNAQVLVIMLDGFRYDYMDRYELPSFRSLKERGTRVPAFVPEMPAFCFTNFYSLFTGREPLKHGYITNSNGDRLMGRTFYNGTSADWSHTELWNRSEPVWISAKRQSRRVALFSWPICSLPQLNGDHRPDRCEMYADFRSELMEAPNETNQNRNQSADDEGMDLCSKIATPVLRSANRFTNDLSDALLELQNGAELVGVFTDLVDLLGRMHGPESNALGEALLTTLEPALARLLEALDSPCGNDGDPKFKLSETVNVVMLSDHGMSPLLFQGESHLSLDDLEPRTVDLSSSWKNAEVEATFGGGAFVSIYPVKRILSANGGLKDFVASVRRRMKPEQRSVVSFYTRDEMILEMLRWDSAEFNFIDSSTLELHDVGLLQLRDQNISADIRNLIAPLVAVAKPGWFLKTKEVNRIPRYAGRAARGWHGYNLQDPEMWGLFLAFGPAFESQRVVEVRGIDNTGFLRPRDVYLLLTDLLQIEPSPHSASPKRVAHVMNRARFAVHGVSTPSTGTIYSRIEPRWRNSWTLMLVVMTFALTAFASVTFVIAYVLLCSRTSKAVGDNFVGLHRENRSWHFPRWFSRRPNASWTQSKMLLFNSDFYESASQCGATPNDV